MLRGNREQNHWGRISQPGRVVQTRKPGEGFTLGCQKERKGQGMVGIREISDLTSIFFTAWETRQCAESELERWKVGDFGVTARK